MTLEELGWSEFQESAVATLGENSWTPARVCVQNRGGYEIITAEGELYAELSGKFRHDALDPSAYPAVGDWVMVQTYLAEKKGIIQCLLPRRSKFSRNRAGDGVVEQVVAANVDEVFIVAGLNIELNLRRLERYLALAWESGASPVVVLTKADLLKASEVTQAMDQLVTIGAPVYVVSSQSGKGLTELTKRLKLYRTYALLGPSGVGKSTLINALCKDEVQLVQEVRDIDGKGRHTTTRRELIALPCRSWVIDTPGMREVQLWEGAEGIAGAFSDVEELATRCRFSNCSHSSEPGCAVRAAIEAGSLDSGRFASYLKLLNEEAYFDRRRDVRAQAEEKKRMKKIHKNQKSYYKNDH